MIDNAATHSGNHEIGVSLREAGLGVRIEIRDHGPGVERLENMSSCRMAATFAFGIPWGGNLFFL
ncbi:hypothetical protein [Enterocloster lavalensis]|uniref:hypothetical protein n=1 Tax=Enterocloster lavalensis TaxID=460384 RepID=UPI003AB93925